MKKDVFHMLDYIHYELFQEELMDWAKINNINFKYTGTIRENIKRNDCKLGFVILEIISHDTEKSILLTTENELSIENKRKTKSFYIPTVEVWLSVEKINNHQYSYDFEEYIDITLSDLIPYLERHLKLSIEK
ncbi:hypothetical protein [Bacillus cereus group sp. TH152-1LC]|uniref:hypothetical protein n=1 Tax=Bacillus cereus group sp. TH152-1LC TaxID=3018060 RepID=UPI0022E2E90A|nr:hypothetical protein [Bacillus cereus group sp. TH152-1LC]MDA1675213.1 hypothetical protein [Bacillus cereus group sp. TH152-1LC]